MTKVSKDELNFYLETDYPVAWDSYDYLYPLGATKDNSRNPRFNQKLYRFAGAVLDLGCAGGGFVKNCIEDNRLAVGLEGNDFNFNNECFEWATIPNYLFTCDITKPFIVHTGDRKPYRFGVITAWDVLEHILEQDLPPLFANIRRHLAADGLFIASIANFSSPNPKYSKIEMHRTMQGLDWWLKKMSAVGLKRDEKLERYFDKDWVRKIRRGSYHIVTRLVI